jgi:DNA primase
VNDNKVIKFLFLPVEHDPDSFVREYGADAFASEVQNAMPLSQFLIKEVSADNDLATAEGRAKTQFEAKPLLQQMAPSALRLQLVRNLAQITQSTAAEIEALFELSQPVARVKIAPPKSRRSAPVGLERQVMRILVAHPSLAVMMTPAMMDCAAKIAPDGADMLKQLVALAQPMGEQANFAALAETLRATSADFDPLIAEIAEQTESEIEVVRLELAGALRQMRTQVLKLEMEQLAQRGLREAADVARYREIMQLQDAIRREAEAESSNSVQ